MHRCSCICACGCTYRPWTDCLATRSRAHKEEECVNSNVRPGRNQYKFRMKPVSCAFMLHCQQLVCVRACMHACMRACLRACVHVCVRACHG